MSIASFGSESTSTRWSDALAGDYEYEGVTRDAGLVERSALSHNHIFVSDSSVGGSSTIEAGVLVVDAGSGVFEVAVIRQDESAGKCSGCSVPIVSCACMCNSCAVASLGGLSRLYELFIR